MTTCAPASSISTLHPQQAILGASNNTIESSFQNCCTKANGAYTSPEGDCYSHCYYYNAASSTRLHSCFNKTLDNPNDSSLDFKMFTDVPLSSNLTITSSASAVMTLVPVATPSYAFSNSSAALNATSVTSLSGNSSILANQTSSASVVTSTALSTAGSGGNGTATSIVIAPGPSPTVATPASGTSKAPASTSKSKASRGVTASVGTIAVVGLAFMAVFV